MVWIPGGTFWQAWSEFLDAEVEPRGLVSPDDRALFLVTDQVGEPGTRPEPGQRAGGQVALGPGTTVEEAERRLILMTLEHTRDNKTRAAEILGISLKTLHNKLNKLRLRPKKTE